MPLVFTKDQIRDYLKNEGYNVNENELNAFIHDLKRVVKHEDRKRRRKRLGHESDSTKFETTTESHDEGIYYVANEDEQEDEGVHSSSDSPTTFEDSGESGEYETTDELLSQTVKLYQSPKHHAVKSREENTVSERPRPSVQETRSTSRSHIVMDRKTVIVNGDKEPIIIDSKVPIPINTDIPDTKTERVLARVSKDPVVNSSAIKPLKPSNRHSIPLKSTVPNKPWDSTTGEQGQPGKVPSSTTEDLMAMLQDMDKADKDVDPAPVKKAPIGPPDAIKRDPVALYHFYKAIWDKQERPGESRHMKLRWNVRVQTVGKYPCINGQPIKYLRQ